jgi:hypothetical protein
MVVRRREIEDLRRRVRDMSNELGATKLLLFHARREGLTDDALRRTLRDAVEFERLASENDPGGSAWFPDWESFAEDPEYGMLVQDLAWEVAARRLEKTRPPAMDGAQEVARAVAEEFELSPRDADALADTVKFFWREIAYVYERVEDEDHQYK